MRALAAAESQFASTLFRAGPKSNAASLLLRASELYELCNSFGSARAVKNKVFCGNVR